MPVFVRPQDIADWSRWIEVTASDANWYLSQNVPVIVTQRLANVRVRQSPAAEGASTRGPQMYLVAAWARDLFQRTPDPTRRRQCIKWVLTNYSADPEEGARILQTTYKLDGWDGVDALVSR